MEELFSLISNFGFPIVITVYLLFRFEQRIAKLEDLIDGSDGVISNIKELERTLHQCCNKK